MYSEINTGTWWEDTQVRNSNAWSRILN
jgi:hypothetical protein